VTIAVEALSIPGAYLVTPHLYRDARGWFYESWRENACAAIGIKPPLVQDNLSCSKANVVRGLHYQARDAQGQMVTIVAGRVHDVIVDLRRGSPTFGKHEAIVLDEATPRQIYMPPGVAHGFIVLSERAILHYKCSRYYNPETERGLRWNDPGLGISWPMADPILSPRDAAYPQLSDISADDLPQF